MKCKLNDKCEFGDLCQSATRHDSLTVLGCSSYKAKEPQTNEEYLRSCNTEQLAEWLTNSGFLTCTLRDCEDCKYYDKNNDDCIDGYEATHDKQMWVEWLKQPHK